MREQPGVRKHREIDYSISNADKEDSPTVHIFLFLVKCSGSCCLALTFLQAPAVFLRKIEAIETADLRS